AFSAVADDATAAWYNPAALAFQQGVGIAIGGEVIFPKVNYTKAGKTYRMDKKNHVVPFAYASYNLEGNPLAFGLAVNSPFGLSTDWSNSKSPFTTAAGGITFSQIEIININPSIAYQINDELSVSVGVMYYDAIKLAFDTTAVTQHGKGDGWGGNASLFYQGNDFNIGLSYRSRVKIDVSGTATGASGLTALGAGALIGTSTAVNVDVTMPDIVSAGIAFHASENWLISVQADWINWKTYDKLVFTYGASPLVSNVIQDNPKTDPQNWKAVTSYALGSQYSFDKTMHLRAGYAFEPSPVNSVDFSPRIADNDRHFFTLGYGQDFSNAGTLNFAYGYLLFKTLNQSASKGANIKRNGQYKTTMHIIAADYTQHF
ncbi:MAG: outer membrane protein transport protein, partial [Mariprofundaceae bacterium]